MQRDRLGRIPKGQSGNRRGRPPKALKPLETPADLREVIKRVANRPISIPIDGKQVTVAQYEASVYILAAGGGTKRLGIKAFLDIADRAFDRIERLDRPRLAKQAFGIPSSSESKK